MAIVTTVGSASANSYADIEYAVAFFQSSVWAADWSALGSEEQESVLLTGMDVLGSKRFPGIRSTSTQSPDWPRTLTYAQVETLADITTPESWLDLAGHSWDSDIVPEPLKKAQCLLGLAEHFELQGDDTATDDDAEFWAGSVRIMGGKASDRLRAKAGNLRKQAERILRGLVIPGGESFR